MCGCQSSSAQVTTPASVAGVVFAVDDMNCGHCVGTIRRALETGMPGTVFAIDLAARRVTVAGDPARAEGIIRDAGYEPVPVAH